MKKYMTKAFAKWAADQNLPPDELLSAINEVIDGVFEANLGGHLYKKRIRFKGKGKSGSGRTIICYKSDSRACFLFGFAKNTKSSLGRSELKAFKAVAKSFLGFSNVELKMVLNSGDVVEVEK